MEVQALQNRPALNRWVAEYWNAYQILGGSRMVHQGGIGPIPLSEIVAYMETIYVHDVDERLKFIRMIQSLDNVYVAHINDRAKKRAEQQRLQARQKGTPRKRAP